MCRTKEKRVTRPASLSLLNPVHGAQVAPQRCPILRDGKKHFYDTICIRFMSMYNCCAEGVQFAATEVFSFLRRHCSVSNGAGVQRERYIHEGSPFCSSHARKRVTYRLFCNNQSALTCFQRGAILSVKPPMNIRM